MVDVMHGALMSSAKQDWITPPWLIERARFILGEIDLDPASSFLANQFVRAGRYLNEADNSLELPWEGRIWLNPPYGRLVGPFIKKLKAEVDKWNVEQALVLVAARTDTKWFSLLDEYPRVFFNRRIKFVTNDGSILPSGYSAPFPSALIGIGVSAEILSACFSDVGATYQLVPKGR